MFKKFIPVAVVALTAFAAAGTASADETIFARDDAAIALNALDAQSGQHASVKQTQAQAPVRSSGLYNPAASVNDEDWFKDH